MNFLPTALIVEQLHMKALVAVLLRGIDIVRLTARTFLEIVRQHGIDIKAQFLLLLKIVCVIDYADIVLAIYMVEVTPFSMHLAPNAIRHTIAKFYPCLDAIVFQQLAYL